MRSAHTVAQVRDAEAVLLDALPEGALMQRAAVGLAHAVADFLGAVVGARVLVLAGSGDNGGDALWAGAHLARRGASVEAVLLAPSRTHEAGLAALLAAGGRVVEARDSSPPDVLLDGIVGIGGRGGLRPEAVDALAVHPDAPTVAVDVPSGVDVDTGEIDGPHVTADLTVTFGSYKVCHLVEPAASACGAVELVDIGLELPPAAVRALGPADVRALLPRPDAAAQKYSRGVVGVRTGSEQYPGAGVLSTAGASSGFAGMVRYAGGARDAVLAAHPEVVPGVGRVQAWVVGSGGGADAERALRESAGDDVPLVIDADALAHAGRPVGGIAVLTPHAGELARMLGVEREEVEARQLASARRAAQEYDAVVLLKGPRTLIARPDGRVDVNTTGVPWLATAGAGDVLAGLIGSLVAAGLDPFDAAAVGAWLHGAAATVASRRRGGPITAGDLPGALGDVLAGLADDAS
ncbi:NAD(P)H-hydrate dehydratase [Nocardioides rotundus]|uniref:NAD(P)H-hydrate dehydratase n=1 Tax=Nocardioides rotundus TaxID=1774216 RepID=UPI001CBDFD1E|nr:NAD(P)H-hydrate dehydratase [Nocardioides rotundus]UAL30936.1 NAD(P)H-hydrate dehydratase [Nocardioides rotundus]